ncbi:MAG: D-alanine--D-alanine ligase [Nevskiaceae bacterium]|jgi:D-alanine-D-alanine ligase|nr:D-alanine--D-alanine ligase [Nevskiaceae bacterium]
MRLAHDPARMRRITDARDFGRVAVLLGGTSPEREVSLKSGAAVLAALQRRGVDAQSFDPRDTALGELLTRGVDRVWNALHGPGGEDGTLQGALEMLGVPYTGSGVLGSALAMDKLRTKRLAAAVGVQTPESFVLRSASDCALALERLGLPVIIKPATQGSSVGMTKVESAEQMLPAYELAAAVDDVVFAESWISGAEYTVAVLHRRVLPAIRVQTPRNFYDYEAKYLRNDTTYHCPAGLSAPAEAHLASLALAAFDAVGASGWGRVDFMADSTGRPLLLELNTVPGMTDHSLVPMAARAAGIDFDELCWQVLETSFARHRLAQEGQR